MLTPFQMIFVLFWLIIGGLLIHVAGGVEHILRDLHVFDSLEVRQRRKLLIQQRAEDSFIERFQINDVFAVWQHNRPAGNHVHFTNSFVSMALGRSGSVAFPIFLISATVLSRLRSQRMFFKPTRPER